MRQPNDHVPITQAMRSHPWRNMGDDPGAVRAWRARIDPRVHACKHIQLCLNPCRGRLQQMQAIVTAALLLAGIQAVLIMCSDGMTM